MSKIIKLEIFRLNELRDGAKTRALDELREMEDFAFLSDDLDWKMRELLEENNVDIIDEPKVYYSLNHCQGDGVCFVGKFGWKDYVITAKKDDTRYNHSNTVVLEYENVNDDNEETRYDDNEQFNDLYECFCKELEDYGYDIIESQLSEECLIEASEANDWYFYQNGELYN